MDTDRRVGVTERLPLTSGEGSTRPVDPVAPPHRRPGRAEVLVAVVAFAALCLAVLIGLGAWSYADLAAGGMGGPGGGAPGMGGPGFGSSGGPPGFGGPGGAPPGVGAPPGG